MTKSPTALLFFDQRDQLIVRNFPCVFWKDYYNGGLAKEGTPNGIAALVRSHEKYAGGSTQVLWVDDDIYIMAHNGFADQSGLVFVLNNKRSE